jgi:hypothetical protein
MEEILFDDCLYDNGDTSNFFFLFFHFFILYFVFFHFSKYQPFYYDQVIITFHVFIAYTLSYSSINVLDGILVTNAIEGPKKIISHCEPDWTVEYYQFGF